MSSSDLGVQAWPQPPNHLFGQGILLYSITRHCETVLAWHILSKNIVVLHNKVHISLRSSKFCAAALTWPPMHDLRWPQPPSHLWGQDIFLCFMTKSVSRFVWSETMSLSLRALLWPPVTSDVKFHLIRPTICGVKEHCCISWISPYVVSYDKLKCYPPATSYDLRWPRIWDLT